MANTPMGDSDLETPTRFQFQFRQMHVSSMDKPENGKFLMSMVLEASKAET